MLDWIRKHWKNLHYLVAHKYYVFKAGRRLGVNGLQLLLHDLSKFRPSEWIPYTNYFYYKDKPIDSRYLTLYDSAFRKACILHQRRNKHHWEYWYCENCWICDGQPRPIPDKYIREMVADWIGAGYTKKGYVDVMEWYEEMKDKLILHWSARQLIEKLIREYYIDYDTSKL